MKMRFAFLWIIVGLWGACRAGAFETATPEAEGVSSRAILAWIGAVEQELDVVHSFVFVRHGKIIAEGWWAPYAKNRTHMLYSLSKSFTSTAVGLAADEGRLKLDDRVLSFFPDEAPADPGANLQAMRVRDLLCMGSGHSKDTLPVIRARMNENWARLFLAQPVEHTPGTFFRYNTGATYMLSAIVQKATGQSVLDYLTPRLFAPLGIEGASWETSPQGVNTGGYGLKVRTQDIARLGQLYLQKGRWNGKQILSEQWIKMATSKQIGNGSKPESDWCQGYGFQFWRCRHNAYRGDGAFGQYCLVMPDQDAVLAITAGLGDMQEELNTVWTHLLPAMQPTPLPPDAEGQMRLAKRLASLALPTVKGERTTSAGVDGVTYEFADNDKGLKSLMLKSDERGTSLVLDNVHGRQTIACGFDAWVPGQITFEKTQIQAVGTTNGRQSVAASGAWTAPDCYTVFVYFNETPSRLTISLHFAGDRLQAELAYNVFFDSPRNWRLTGIKKHS